MHKALLTAGTQGGPWVMFTSGLSLRTGALLKSVFLSKIFCQPPYRYKRDCGKYFFPILFQSLHSKNVLESLLPQKTQELKVLL